MQRATHSLTHSLSSLASAAALAVAGAALDADCCAQDTPQRARQITVWVDPMRGDDALALQTNVTLLNPVGCAPNQLAPNHALNTSGQPLLHQPYPFRTITAAVAYINSLPPTVSATDPLPHSTTSSVFVWQHAIIQCLPGRYASANAQEPQSAHNLLFANGETFPIELPNRVSIQGTSALDTVIELARGEGPAFRVGRTSGSTGLDGSFISSLSIVGGGSDLIRHPPQIPTGPLQHAAAAIAVAADQPSTLRVDDCFFFGNGVGILVDAPDGGEVVHEVSVVNCTFAWNVVGIWSGDTQAIEQTVGRSRLLLLNNIFDTSPPTLAKLITPSCGTGTRPFPQRWGEACGDMAFAGVYGRSAMSAFEGVDATDMRLQLPGGGGALNTNAYDSAAVNKSYDRRVAYPSMLLPATLPRVASPGDPDTGFDIAEFTGGAEGSDAERGVLFIADLFRNGYELGIGTATNRFATPVSCDFDLSPMDFRLAPAVAEAQAASSPPAVPGTAGSLNPLVDRGYALFPITMQNQMVLASHPRTIDLGLESGTWPFSDWSDFDDCEGFGNRRIVDHPVYPNEGPSTGARIDVGADEVDLLIIAGHRYGTRIYTQGSGLTGGPNPVPYMVDNRYVWLFGPPDSLTSVPVDAGYAFASTNWWATPGPAAYTASLTPPWPTWSPSQPSTYYNPLVTDTTPHLLPDSHPYHSVTTAADWPSNPVWQDCPGHPLQSLHNPFLYVDPTAPIANPAGAYPAIPAPGFAFLDGATSPWSGHTLPAAGATVWPFGPSIAGGGASYPQSFADWCQVRESAPGSPALEAHILGLVLSTGANTWNHVYPHQDPIGLGGSTDYEFPVDGAERLTLEFMMDGYAAGSGAAFGYQGPSNVQTFMIWRQM